MKNNLLVLLAKYPEPGTVKTRLGKDIGMEAAAQIQRQMLEDIIKNLSNNPDYDFVVCLKPFIKAQQFADEFHIPLKNIYSQLDSDYLGDKMYSVFEQFLPQYNKVALIGSDTPTITEGDVIEVFTTLESTDIVLGPTTDGGYYTVAMSTPHKELFTNITYSTDRVLSDTLEACKNHSLSYYLLRTQTDLDTIKELKHSKYYE